MEMTTQRINSGHRVTVDPNAQGFSQVVKELERMIEMDLVEHLLVAVSDHNWVTILADDMKMHDHMSLIGFLQADGVMRLWSSYAMGPIVEEDLIVQQNRAAKKQGKVGNPDECLNLLEVSGPLEPLKLFHEKMTRRNQAGYSSPFANIAPLPDNFDQMNRSWQRNWCQKNWGDKRDPHYFCNYAGDQPQENGDNLYEYQYRFETSWDPPVPWLEKASQQAPELELRLYYFDMFCGFAGETQFQSGKCLKQSEHTRADAAYGRIGRTKFGQDDGANIPY